MVPRNVSLQDLYILLTAHLTDYLAHSVSDLPDHHGLAVLCRPDDMQVDVEHRVRSVTVAHPVTLPPYFMLKLSPEGEGFNPPKVGQ
jgi:hypothetical protein